MERYLLNHIKELETKLSEVSEKEGKLKKLSNNLKKLCKPILEINLINKDIKIKINKYLNSLINNLEVEKFSKFYENNYLTRKTFFQFIEKFDLSEKVLFIFKLRDSSEVEFGCSFIESKFTPFLFIDVNRVIGVMDKKLLKQFEKTKFIPFFKDEYKELSFFVTFFEIDKLNEMEFKKALNLFNRFYLKPSMTDKSFVHYSLIENKMIDFELIEKEKIKKEFAFINDLKYPEIELMIRKEIKNIKFVLALLDRIDNELQSIKKSKGTIIVVKRILSFIHKFQLDAQIQEMSELISQELEKKDYLR